MAAPSDIKRWRWGLPPGVPVVPPPRRRPTPPPPDAIEVAKRLQRAHRDQLDAEWRTFAQAEPEGAAMFVQLKERFGQLYLTPTDSSERPYRWRAIDMRMATGEKIKLLSGKDFDKWMTRKALKESSSRTTRRQSSSS